MREELVLLNHVKQARTEAGLSQAQLAEKLFVTRSTVAKWENGLGFFLISDMDWVLQLMRSSTPICSPDWSKK